MPYFFQNLCYSDKKTINKIYFFDRNNESAVLNEKNKKISNGINL